MRLKRGALIGTAELKRIFEVLDGTKGLADHIRRTPRIVQHRNVVKILAELCSNTASAALNCLAVAALYAALGEMRWVC